MHELSIVESLIELCEENALNNKACNVQEIYVKIGRLSGIEVDLFKRCFETFKENSNICKNAKLFIELAPLGNFMFKMRSNKYFRRKCF